MDLTRKLEEEFEPASEEERLKGEQIIKSAIIHNSQCFWPDIVERNNGEVSFDTLLRASRSLQSKRVIRLKEDPYEHDYEYILR